MSTLIVLALVGGLCAGIGTGWVRRYAVARDLIDHPNARGSHVVATPRGGGLALAVVLIVGTGVAAALDLVSVALAWAMLAGGGAVAGVGFLDDHREVPARWRLLAYTLASGVAVLAIGHVQALALPGGALPLAWAGAPLTLIAGVSLINIYNFMDGIDGLACSELVCVCFGLLALSGLGGPLAALVLLGSAAGLGFLAWNWPPARIFLGDVGSGFLGFFIAVVLLGGVLAEAWSFWAGLLLLGVFFVDASVTLATRAMRGDRVGEAHRTHAFQHFAQRFGHLRVTASVCLVNLCWLLPAALLAESRPAWGLPILLVSWAPLLAAALWVGAGRPR
ncbi:MAG: glycosyltransferase family 4 protein [Pseudomonadota bacterium]|nr:glycosyltransferase family 4 protein [Pseudomonadota bacterium]